MDEIKYQTALSLFEKKQYREAYERLMAFAQQGHAEAQCLIGNFFDLGLGEIKIDKEEAKNWYRKSSDQGYGVASNNLSTLATLEGDQIAAAKWSAIAKTQGFES